VAGPHSKSPLSDFAGISGNPPLRGTQLLVAHMSTVFKRPTPVAIEIGWRWLFGIPFLLVCGKQAHQVLAAFPLDASGFNSIDAQNPWVAAAQLSNVWRYYAPHVGTVLHWLLPVAALAWIVISGVGRAVLLRKMVSNAGRRLPFRPGTIVLLQAVWLGLFALVVWGWFRSMQWVAETHIAVTGEPDLIGFAIWAIFLALGFFTLWALVSWTVSIAPLLALLEWHSAFSALVESLALGRAFAGKLAEINLVLGIVKLALLVLAMVFSAAPLPFSDVLGTSALHGVWAASFVFYLVANDYFQVVRLEAFGEFWKVFRGERS
jgi:hypothetical protein